MSIYFLIYLIILIAWAFTKPWKKKGQFVMFYVAVILFPSFIIFQSGSLTEITPKELLNFITCGVIVFFILFRLRTTESVTGLFLLKKNTAAEGETEAEKKYNERVMKWLLIIGYLLCGLYFFLYGPVNQ